MVGFKVHQTELIIAIAQIYGRKVSREDALTVSVNVSDMFEWILSWKSAMLILKLSVNRL